MNIFKISGLEKFYLKVKSLGETILFKDYKGGKVFLIRHDVDFDLNLALNLAKFENEIGIRSTYFVLTSCESYNVLCEKNKLILKKIISLGHEIGLHFDPSIYKDNLDDIVKKECSILSFASDSTIKSISIHNPTVHGQYPIFDNMVNAYDKNLFSDKNYLSDSCFDFRGKDPFEFINKIENGMVQILLHPLHFSRDGWGYDDIFFESFKLYFDSVKSNWMINSTFKNHFSKVNIQLKKN